MYGYFLFFIIFICFIILDMSLSYVYNHIVHIYLYLCFFLSILNIRDGCTRRVDETRRLAATWVGSRAMDRSCNVLRISESVPRWI